MQLDSMYQECKKSIEMEINLPNSKPDELKKSLDLSRFEIREFKNRFFPKENELVVFNRVEFLKTPRTDLSNDALLKKKLLTFSKYNFKSLNYWINYSFIEFNSLISILLLKMSPGIMFQKVFQHKRKCHHFSMVN